MRTVPFPQSGRAFGSGTPAGAPGLEGGPQGHRGYHDPGYSVPGVPSPRPRGLSARASAATRTLCPGPTHTELSLRCPNLLLPPETPGACAWGLSSPVSPSFLCRHSGGAGAPRPGAFRPHVAVRGKPFFPSAVSEVRRLRLPGPDWACGPLGPLRSLQPCVQSSLWTCAPLRRDDAFQPLPASSGGRETGRCLDYWACVGSKALVYTGLHPASAFGRWCVRKFPGRHFAGHFGVLSRPRYQA